ncbi:hypothetical protein [Nonomuraea rhizosphaerae]|uniref:hypothetical protein n=1 Tax=Nonomuraea rhizosphaerae TaxID=2665663 RepID=UPI001C607F03|nr:hypothetical protein [Nonomuraea rhizosphaerae]
MSVLRKAQLRRDLDDGGTGFLLYGLIELSDGTGYKIETREEYYNARGDNTFFERNEEVFDDPDEAAAEYETWVAEAQESGWQS